jgi:UDP-glucuronate decarboxylase
VYGDPLVNPQPETYWGNVNPIGVRGVYDEGKRFGEALVMAYHRTHGLATRMVRIFNSVLAHEQILYDNGTELVRETAGDFARRVGSGDVTLDGIRVPAFDQRGRVTSRPAAAFASHATDKRSYEVHTRYGRSISVTEDHSLFVRGDDGVPTPKANG